MDMYLPDWFYEKLPLTGDRVSRMRVAKSVADQQRLGWLSNIFPEVPTSVTLLEGSDGRGAWLYTFPNQRVYFDCWAGGVKYGEHFRPSFSPLEMTPVCEGRLREVLDFLSLDPLYR